MPAAGAQEQIRKCRTIKAYETQNRLKCAKPRGQQSLRERSTTTIRCLLIQHLFVAETSMRCAGTRTDRHLCWRSVPPDDRMGDSSVKSGSCGRGLLWTVLSCCVRISRKQIEKLEACTALMRLREGKKHDACLA
ncbi:hypothetical protein B0H65DRAFT_510591 [Neurospora tetraspora]|uniref:Uncharacterized protein n=1 Tax=Neurospora tetraspora TaxID=94610 RepID=A0AAE0JAL6_9PEZI|nr:hypothetical protein B0H65DRAFT_510591 [Neurospora tetraspora]